jgi:hypothetical protein
MHTATRPTGRVRGKELLLRNVAISDCPYRFTKLTVEHSDGKRMMTTSKLVIGKQVGDNRTAKNGAIEKTAFQAIFRLKRQGFKLNSHWPI